jgi:hypothetical protein
MSSTSHDEVLAKPGDKDITLIMRSPDTWHWVGWPFEWSYLDGETWQNSPAKSEVNQGAWRVTFSRLRPLEPHTVMAKPLAARGWRYRCLRSG